MYRSHLTIAFVCCLLLSSCKQKQAPPPMPIPVNLFTVKARPVVYYDRYTSTTVALNQVNLLSQVQGYITAIFFKEGSHVKKGEKLYEIDRRIYESNYNAAAANLKVEEGNLKQAHQDADLYEYLNNDRAVNSLTGTLRIRLVFPNLKSSLRSGMSCVVRVRNQDSSPQLIIPNKAVIEEMGEYSVYLAKDTVMISSADTARKAHALKGNHGLFAFQKKVQPGVTVGSNVIIKNGIKEGDKIVVDGVQSLHNGSQIASSDQRSSGKTGTQPVIK